MTSMLDTQEVETTEVVADKQVDATVTSTCHDQVMTELQPLIGLKFQVPSSPSHTIELTNSYVEGGISLVRVTKEVDNGNNLQEFMKKHNLLLGLILFPQHCSSC